MTRSSWIPVLSILALAAAATPALPGAARAQDAPVQVEQHADCRWGDDRDDRYCEVREFELDGRSSLTVDAGGNGGIDVTGWDRPGIRLVARVQTRRDDGDPRELARDIEIRTGDLIEASGPRARRGEGWSVSFALMVPRGTELRLRATNGGISLANLAGDVEARTTNGGIELIGGEGRVRGETTNGGLHLQLTGGAWQGVGVDLRTTNGGVEIAVPEGFSAELETGTVNGGMQIDIPVTVQGRLDRTLRAELNGGGALVRAMTTNGGVVIRGH